MASWTRAGPVRELEAIDEKIDGSGDANTGESGLTAAAAADVDA